MSIEFIFRIIGMIVFGIIGIYYGTQLGRIANITPGPNTISIEQYAFSMMLVGALIGLVLTPLITVRPMRALRSLLSRVSIQTLFAALIGLVVGLTVAVLLSFPLSLLPNSFGRILPFVGVLILGYFGISIFVTRQSELFNLLRTLSPQPAQVAGEVEAPSIAKTWSEGRTILLDTSVIIDGRIVDIARNGFLPGTLLIPRFVLAELQFIADSSNGLRRQRGRRGMEVLSQLQHEPGIPVRLSDIDAEGVHEVDDKLVILARQLHCPILTNDYNLNRIAELQGVMVLNVNELANAVKTVLLPGESLLIRVIQDGKESGQGVGYMDDGTMVVVENGREHMGQEVAVNVTKVLQTAAGRMIFAKPE